MDEEVKRNLVIKSKLDEAIHAVYSAWSLESRSLMPDDQLKEMEEAMMLLVKAKARMDP